LRIPGDVDHRSELMSINMIRKGRVKWLAKEDAIVQALFIG